MTKEKPPEVNRAVKSIKKPGQDLRHHRVVT
jgi:hypothetical protein